MKWREERGEGGERGVMEGLITKGSLPGCQAARLPWIHLIF